MKKLLWGLAGILAIGVVVIPLFAQQPPPGQRGGAQGTVQTPAAPTAQGTPQATGQPGAQAAGRAGQAPGAQAAGRGMMMGRGVQAIPTTFEEPLPKVPVGFTPIFNGKDLTGWHISKTNHHGTTPDYHVVHGMIVATQQPIGPGRHPADRQEVQKRRGLHGGQAGLGLRRRVVLLGGREPAADTRSCSTTCPAGRWWPASMAR